MAHIRHIEILKALGFAVDSWDGEYRWYEAPVSTSDLRAIETLPVDDAWLAIDVSTLGLSTDMASKLLAYQIETIRDLRRAAYVEDGLTVEEFINIQLDGNDKAMAAFKAKRANIKLLHPWPAGYKKE